MAEPVNIFIPAAGLGERLRPITYEIPKPLLPIAGRPVLAIILERLACHAKRFGMNLHYRKDDLQAWIESSAFREGIVLFPEEPLLGTGGALKNAEGLLSEGVFLVHNSDVLCDMDIERLIEVHRSSENVVTLAVHDFPDFNTIAVDGDGFLRGVGVSLIHDQGETRRVAFTGIAAYSPDFLKFLPKGVSSVVDAWLYALKSGMRIGTHDVSGCYWSDIGTPSAYAAAVVEAMRADGEIVYIHSTARGCRHVAMDGYVVMEEKSSAEHGVSLRNCILLPGSRLTAGGSFENSIIGPAFEIPLKEGEMLSPSGDGNIIPIGSGGSERKYYRLREGKRSSVLVQFGSGSEDFDRHIAYTDFFRRYSVPVPALLRLDRERGEAVFEDLGDLSLYGWLKCPRSVEETLRLYRKVLDIAVTMHTDVTDHVAECPQLTEKLFDYDHLRWETGYFGENFVLGLRGMRMKDSSLLEKDLHLLARKADSLPKTVIHRDFQSQNIMVTKVEIPRVIDYQGARIGPPAYDIASLLWDPYYRIQETLRERLLDYYVGRMEAKGASGFDEETFRSALLPCRLQRHMQALGAYAFLSVVKGKRYFLKHVEEGVRLLKEDIEAAREEYPSLYEVASQL